MVTVYGQVIADDVFGEIYMISMRDIIDDISFLLKANVRLPRTVSELEMLLGDQYMRKHGDDLEPTEYDEIHDIISRPLPRPVEYFYPKFQDDSMEPNLQEEHSVDEWMSPEIWEGSITSEDPDTWRTRRTQTMASPRDKRAAAVPHWFQESIRVSSSSTSSPSMYEQSNDSQFADDDTSYTGQRRDDDLGDNYATLNKGQSRLVHDLEPAVRPIVFVMKREKSPRSQKPPQFPKRSKQTSNATGKAKAEWNDDSEYESSLVIPDLKSPTKEYFASTSGPEDDSGKEIATDLRYVYE